MLGFYCNEKKLVVFLLLFSMFFFYVGMVFVYFVVFFIVFVFFNSVVLEGVMVSMDILSYLNFVLKLFFVFGVLFEIFIVIILLCWIGVIDVKLLRVKCFYVVVGVFILGMLLMLLDIIL